MCAHEKCECESMRMRNGVAQIEWLQTLWMCCGCKSFARFGNNRKLVIKLRVFGRWFCVWCDGMFELPAVIFFLLLKENAHLLALHSIYIDAVAPVMIMLTMMKIYQDLLIGPKLMKTINKVLMRFWDRIIDV